MPYHFPPDVEELVKVQMLSGGYGTEDDLLRDALKALEERRHAILEEDPEIIAGIERGLADMQAGRSRPLDEFDVEFRVRP